MWGGLFEGHFLGGVLLRRAYCGGWYGDEAVDLLVVYLLVGHHGIHGGLRASLSADLIVCESFSRTQGSMLLISKKPS